MQEVLKKLYGEAVTEESLAVFHEELGKRFVAKADFNQRGEELKALREQVARLEEALESGQEAAAEAEGLRTALQEAEQRHSEEMAAYAAQETEKQLREAVDRELTAAGARSLPAVKALLDMDRITLENGLLKGLEEQLWELKKENSYLFASENQMFQFIRPAAKAGSEMDREDFQKMGYMERLKMKREQPELYQMMSQINRR